MAHKHLPAEDPILEWSAPQHHHPKRGTAWYICAVAFVALCVGYSIWTAAWTFSFLIVVVTAVYWKLHGRVPVMHDMKIFERGFAIDDRYTEWEKCNGYWILQGHDYFELNIEKKNGTHIKILTGDVNPYVVHETLQPLSPQLTDRRERVLDTIIRICKL